MPSTYSLALHLFRRDLRLHDNTALLAALKSADKVIPCFIFDKRQIEQNDYKSDPCIQFMVTSLQDLEEQLHRQQGKLFYFYGIAEEVIAELIDRLPIQAVFVNRDYTPFSLMRDQNMAAQCKKKGVDFHIYADALLHEPEEIHKANKQPYTVFTHFHRQAAEKSVAAPQKNTHKNYYLGDISFVDHKTLSLLAKKINPNLLVKGGREEARSLLKQAAQLKNYAEIRNIPSVVGTTKLSAHNKFGTLSIRELYHFFVKTFGPHHQLITELYWRDFFTHIAFHYPRVFKTAFHQKYAGLAWDNNEKYFRAWREGQTGFPIVDAGMRELNTTGYMHNRVRMIVASFLVKDLHIDWRLGEKYFAQKLVDYDPAVNNGNWQWAASTGCDAQPYFRIFNPWLQQQKFDPDCLYIKSWIPELAKFAPKILHQLPTHTTLLMTNYPSPIVDHALESHKAKSLYKKMA